MIPRWLTPLLVVIFVLLTIWAGYNLSVQLSSTRSPSSPSPVLTYEDSGLYSYIATLTPNDLYNSTTVSGTNVTLFAPITRWVNVTFVDGVTLDSPAATQLVDQFTVTLSTPVWSKTIDQGVQENASSNSTSIAVIDRYSLNVSWVENLTQTIDSQLGYSSSQFTVMLAPVVAGHITLGNKEAPVSMSPFLNFTFASSLITPKGLPSNSEGDILGGPSDSGNAGAVTDAYLFLAASLGALAVSIGLLWATRGRTKSSVLPDLDTLIEPYEEVIARTSREPQASMVFPVEQFEDLVKVSDTLGRPILRPVGRPENPSGTSFYVVDGSVAYRYGYPVSLNSSDEGTPPKSDPIENHSDLRAESNAPVSVETETPEGPTTRPGRANTGALGSTRITAEQLRADLERIQMTPLSLATRAKAFDLVRRTTQLLRSARPSEAQRILEEFHQTLEGYLREPPSSR